MVRGDSPEAIASFRLEYDAARRPRRLRIDGAGKGLQILVKYRYVQRCRKHPPKAFRIPIPKKAVRLGPADFDGENPLIFPPSEGTEEGHGNPGVREN